MSPTPNACPANAAAHRQILVHAGAGIVLSDAALAVGLAAMLAAHEREQEQLEHAKRERRNAARRQRQACGIDCLRCGGKGCQFVRGAA